MAAEPGTVSEEAEVAKRVRLLRDCARTIEDPHYGYAESLEEIASEIEAGALHLRPDHPDTERLREAVESLGRAINRACEDRAPASERLERLKEDHDEALAALSDTEEESRGE